ncbi:hypothetical protein HYX06_05430 [Candidatus Woesearchaeota archaeon]|nr:hypothetical protein [Candidatus Woesearchaeota archaeon]
MAFFRIKKIKGNEYSYIVENEWKKNGSRQKVIGYAGRAYPFNVKNIISFPEFVKIENVEKYVAENGFRKIITDLIEWELFRHEIDKNNFAIDLNSMKVMQNGRNAVLMINEGFMCSLTLNNIFEFRPEGDESNDGYRLARAFVESGIEIPQDVFISLFGKLFKQ